LLEPAHKEAKAHFRFKRKGHQGGGGRQEMLKDGSVKFTIKYLVRLVDDLTSIRAGIMPLDSSLSNKTANEKLKLAKLVTNLFLKTVPSGDCYTV
jgi:hypothetical protein